MRRVSTDLVAITDADCVLHPDYARRIRESFADPEVVAVSGVLESIPQTWVTSARQVEYMFFYGVCQRAESHTNSILVLVGSCTAYRRAVLLEIGFDHPTVSEDISATWRLHAAGRRMVLNSEAKVLVSDPPTLRAYHRQLVRWYTDFWICVKAYPQILGRRAFGAMELPHVMLHMTASSTLFFLVPLLLLLLDPRKLIGFYLLGFLIDVAIVSVAFALYRRPDVWFAAIARTPMRFIARYVWLATMVRVMTGRHRLDWKKIERRPTEAALDLVRSVPRRTE